MRHHAFTKIIALGACLAALPLAPTIAGNVRLAGLGGAFSVPIASISEARWQTVMRQQYDFSCGSAAVATLMTYHYGTPTTEDAVFKEMFRTGNQAKIRAEGFSMLDMKRYLDNRGLAADGFRMSLDQLATTGVPAIALVNTRGYRHFVVIRGIAGDNLLLADPAIGSVVVDRATFTSIWNGIVLAARGELTLARAHFNTERDWHIWPTAPNSNSASYQNGLSTFTLTLPTRHELGK